MTNKQFSEVLAVLFSVTTNVWIVPGKIGNKILIFVLHFWNTIFEDFENFARILRPGTIRVIHG